MCRELPTQSVSADVSGDLNPAKLFKREPGHTLQRRWILPSSPVNPGRLSIQRFEHSCS
jgi:hypothetical protein